LEKKLQSVAIFKKTPIFVLRSQDLAIARLLQKPNKYYCCMRKIRLQQSFSKPSPLPGFEAFFSIIVKNHSNSFHDSIWRNDALRSINAYTAYIFQLIHLTIQMPK